MIAADTGTTKCFKSGADTSRPSTADSTDTAGVMMPSPKNSPAPMIPTSASPARPRSSSAARCASAISARIPPSPLLSARITRMTYLTVTMMISAQKISDSTPRISNSATPVAVNWSRLALNA